MWMMQYDGHVFQGHVDGLAGQVFGGRAEEVVGGVCLMVGHSHPHAPSGWMWSRIPLALLLLQLIWKA